MSPRIESALVLAAVFVLGAITGAGLMTARTSKRLRDVYDAPPAVMRERAVLRGLEREVDLDREQRRQIAAILRRHQDEAQQVRRDIDPRMTALRAQVLEDIRAVMRPEQVAGFEKFAKRAEARARRK